LEANGYGIPELAEDKIFTCTKHVAAIGHRGLVSAALVWASACSSGILSSAASSHSQRGRHCDLPRNEREVRLLNYLFANAEGPREL